MLDFYVIITPLLSLFYFLVLLTYSALCAFCEYEHICFDVCFPPSSNLSLLPAVHFGLSPNLSHADDSVGAH